MHVKQMGSVDCIPSTLSEGTDTPRRGAGGAGAYVDGIGNEVASAGDPVTHAAGGRRVVHDCAREAAGDDIAPARVTALGFRYHVVHGSCRRGAVLAYAIVAPIDGVAVGSGDGPWGLFFHVLRQHDHRRARKPQRLPCQILTPLGPDTWEINFA